MLFVGANETNLPNLLPGLTAYVDSIVMSMLLFTGGAAGAPGQGSLNLPLPIAPTMRGVRPFLQFVVSHLSTMATALE